MHPKGVDNGSRLTFQCFLKNIQHDKKHHTKNKGTMAPIFQALTQDILHLFYPNLCLACAKEPPLGDMPICLKCQVQLPKTHYHLHQENPFTERFWGRLPLFSGAALYHFSKGGHTQRLVHRLKYNNKRQVGLKLGELYGHHLKESPFFKCVSVVVPVPLHPRKLHQRGYNQSDLLAIGLSKGLGCPALLQALRRNVYTTTQTQKSRMDRFENVADAFSVAMPDALRGKHVLLVDDVMTTGATLEACGLQILAVPDTTLSMVTLAIAGD